MRRVFITLILLFLAVPAAAESASYEEVGIFQDSFGSTASFWVAKWNDQEVGVLKVRAHDKEGEANVVLDQEGLNKLKDMAKKLHLYRKKIKDKIMVLETHASGDAAVSAIIVNIGGAQVKAIQVTEKGQDHGFLLDKKTYTELKKLADKTRRKL